MDQITILEELAIQLSEKLVDPAIKDATKREAFRKETQAHLVQVIGALSLTAQSHKSVAEALTDYASFAKASAEPDPEAEQNGHNV